jgi:hypothetical protein
MQDVKEQLELIDRAKQLAGQIVDPKIATIYSALLISEAIRKGKVTTSRKK